MSKKSIITFAAALSLFVQGHAFAQISAANTYKPLVGTGGYSDFKNQYSPYSQNIANSNGNGTVTLRSRHSAMGELKVKFFVPPGVKKFRTSFIPYMANQPGRAAARFLSPPTYSAYQATYQNSNKDLEKTLELLQSNPNQDLLFYSPEGSGVLMMSISSSGLSSYQGEKGGYVYIDFGGIPGGKFMSFDIQLEVDENCYKSWYQSMSNNNGWDGAGNPKDGKTHICSGVIEDSGSDGGNQITASEISAKAESIDARGNLVFKFTLKRPASETEGTNRTSFWIAAHVPAGFLPQEAWFFLTPNGWQQLLSPNPYTVAYQNSQAAQPEKIFNIPVGLSPTDLRNFNAQLYFGYMGSDGKLKDMGMIWSGN